MEKTPDVLSREEILEGNKLMLKFVGYDDNKSDEWIIDCGKFDSSWDDLFEVCEKVSITHGDEMYEVNGKSFNFKHLMFHQVLFNRPYVYRKCVDFIKTYNKWILENELKL